MRDSTGLSYWNNIVIHTKIRRKLRPRPRLIRLSCFAPDTAIVHTTTPKNDRRKRSHSKTFSRVERFENDAFWKRCFLVWMEKTMLSENGDVIKIDTTGRQTTRPWVSKMADRRYHVASISRQFRGPIYWNAHASSSFEHAHWGHKSVFKTDTAL